MGTAGLLTQRNDERDERRYSLRDAYSAGLDAITKLPEAERLRAEAVAQLVGFTAIDGHITSGYLTPQRHLLHGAGVAEAEANRIQRLVRFCTQHPLVVDALATGATTVEHADALLRASAGVDPAEFAHSVDDLLHAADGVEPARTLSQRRADRLVELAARHLTNNHGETNHGDGSRDLEPSGARTTGATVDVVIDLPTLLGARFDLDDHRDPDRNVDWASIHSAFSTGGIAPKRVVEQFLCDASWRALITRGPSIILDYTHAKPELNASQRRAVQRRDRHCQFVGCDPDSRALVEPTTSGSPELTSSRHTAASVPPSWALPPCFSRSLPCLSRSDPAISDVAYSADVSRLRRLWSGPRLVPRPGQT